MSAAVQRCREEKPRQHATILLAFAVAQGTRTWSWRRGRGWRTTKRALGVELTHIRAHTGQRWNELADALAKAAARGQNAGREKQDLKIIFQAAARLAEDKASRKNFSTEPALWPQVERQYDPREGEEAAKHDFSEYSGRLTEEAKDASDRGESAPCGQACDR